MTRRGTLLLVVCAGLSAAAPVSSAQEAVHFALTGHYQLRIDGELDRQARLYLSDGVPRLLVVSERLDAPLLVRSQEQTARVLAKEALSCDEEGERCRLGEEPVATATAAVTVGGGKLRFQSGRHVLLVEPRDPLIGLFSPEDLLAALPEYRRGASAYAPRKGDLRLLGTVKEPVEVEVFFGSWCPHCERFIPRLLAVARQLDPNTYRIRLRGLPHEIDADPVARQFKVKATPTAIVRRGTEELGRITGAMWEHPEGALSAVLFGGS